MSKEALEYKNNNKNTDYSQMSINDLNKLPKHFGIINFKISKTSFFILNIFNDDSSAVKFFWKEHHDLDSLDIWYDICQNEGLYVDVGSHTGLYTLTCLKANHSNKVISIEPFYLNMARLITNLRINNIPIRKFIHQKSKRIDVYCSGTVKKYLPGPIVQDLIFDIINNK